MFLTMSPADRYSNMAKDGFLAYSKWAKYFHTSFSSCIKSDNEVSDVYGEMPYTCVSFYNVLQSRR